MAGLAEISCTPRNSEVGAPSIGAFSPANTVRVVVSCMRGLTMVYAAAAAAPTAIAAMSTRPRAALVGWRRCCGVRGRMSVSSVLENIGRSARSVAASTVSSAPGKPKTSNVADC